MSTKKILLRLKPGVTSPTVNIAVGEYSRLFTATEQPFKCSEKEAATLLHFDDIFIVDEKATELANKPHTPPVTPPAANSGGSTGQQQQSGQ